MRGRVRTTGLRLWYGDVDEPLNPGCISVALLLSGRRAGQSRAERSGAHPPGRGNGEAVDWGLRLGQGGWSMGSGGGVGGRGRGGGGAGTSLCAAAICTQEEMVIISCRSLRWQVKVVVFNVRLTCISFYKWSVTLNVLTIRASGLRKRGSDLWWQRHWLG